MPAAAIVPAVIGAAGSIGSAVIGSKAAKSAANTQAQAAQQVAESARKTSGTAAEDIRTAANEAAGKVSGAAEGAATGVEGVSERAASDVEGASGNANEILRSIYQQALGITTPYLDAGQTGVTSLADLAKGPAFTFSEDDPSYQFRLTEGQKALERSRAAIGGLNSGGTLKALTRYSQDYASTEYQKAFDRFQTERNFRANTLASLVGYGQTAAGQQISAGNTYGTTASGNIMDAARAAGNYRVAGAESAGNFRVGGAESAGRFSVGGTQSAGDYLMQGEQIAGNAITGGANAQAAGTIGSANAWASGIGGVSKSLSELAKEIPRTKKTTGKSN